MANRRLLARGILLVVLLSMTVSLSGCLFTGGGVWLRKIEGRVFDSETGEPIEGAEVFVSYGRDFGGLTHNSQPFDTRWGTSNEDGRFSIAGRLKPYLSEILIWGQVDRTPHLYIYAPGYGYDDLSDRGAGGPDPKWRDMQVPLVPFASLPEDFRSSVITRARSYCGNMPTEACFRLCEVTGDTDLCGFLREEYGSLGEEE